MAKPEDLTLDQLLFNAVLYLFQTDKTETAELLLECEFEEYRDEVEDYTYMVKRWTTVVLLAPAQIKYLLSENNDVAWDDQREIEYYTNFKRNYVVEAFQAVLRRETVIIEPCLQLVTTIQDEWRDYLRKLVKGEKTSNQGNSSSQRKPVVVWNNLNFWSKAEKVIAEALDRAGVMYFPNCMARLGVPEHRHNKEPDFLVCVNGKWGILEVDGKAFHQEAAQDHERDRQFRQQGIKTIERFLAQRCLQEPDEVVATFLRIVQQNG